MIDHYPEVGQAHEVDDLLFGTVESWVAYVREISDYCHSFTLLTTVIESAWRNQD